MAIEPVSGVEELLDIIADDHPWMLILVTILIASLLVVCFYTYFWPVVSGQPEYTTVPLFQEADITYDVSVTKPIWIDPDGETEYELLVELEQNSVLSTTQMITVTVKSLSPFIRLGSNAQNSSMDTRSFRVAPLTSEPQRFYYPVSFIVSRPASHTKTLLVEISLRYDNTKETQNVDLKVDYWSKLVVSIVTGGTLLGFVAFAVRVIRSLVGI